MKARMTPVAYEKGSFPVRTVADLTRKVEVILAVLGLRFLGAIPARFGGDWAAARHSSGLSRSFAVKCAKRPSAPCKTGSPSDGPRIRTRCSMLACVWGGPPHAARGMSGSCCGLAGRTIRCRCCTPWLTGGEFFQLHVALGCGHAELCALADDLGGSGPVQQTGDG
eukprot:scaffold6362_cov378-Prasinococcus_capsulatus_cf.AAC.1